MNNTTNYILTIDDFDYTKCPITSGDNNIIINAHSCPLRHDYPIPVVNTPFDAMQTFNNELTHFRYIVNNLPKTKYIQISHYRRYFTNLPSEGDNIFNQFKVALPRPLLFLYSVRNQFRFCHRDVADLVECFNVMEYLYPEYTKTAEEVLNGNKFYMCNMSIMKVNEFCDYVHFLSTIIDEFCDRRGYSQMYDLRKQGYDDYQSRLGGFLIERLGTVYFTHNYNPDEIMHLPVSLINIPKIKPNTQLI